MTIGSTVPVLVVGGYLGAGKTTLVNELLANTTMRVAVVVNDFGSVNIDASLISSTNSDTIELSNGCVCCAIGESLTDTMLTISERPIQPDAVVIEASGVADPRSVAANAFITGFHLVGIVVLVDEINASATAKNPLLRSTFDRQLRSAHLIVRTKESEATEQQKVMCDELLSSVSTPVISKSLVTLHGLLSHEHAADDSSESPPSHQFRTVTSHDLYFDSLDELHAFCDGLPTSVVRAKGILSVKSGNYLVQRVGTHTAITETTLSPTGLVVIYAD